MTTVVRQDEGSAPGRLARRSAYGAAASAKVGWYTLHYLAGRRLVGPMTRPGEAPQPYETGAPDLSALTTSFRGLLQAEAADVANGTYKLPVGLRRPPSPVRLLRAGRRYLAETRAVARRGQQRGGGTELRDRPPASLDGLPAYYRQNFHFQSDGWLSEASAAIYDTQVETLFTGAADAMRRRALPVMRAELHRLSEEGRAQEDVSVLDVACGTGRLLRDVKDNFPDLRAYAVDLSGPYLQRARRQVAAPGTIYVNALAERLPFPDASVDIAYSVYLFHELPPKVRRQVAAEVARVLRPGGVYVHVDSVQYGDSDPDGNGGFDALLESFPRVFHEPFYDSYAREDLDRLFAPFGLTPERSEARFLTKVSSFRRALDQA